MLFLSFYYRSGEKHPILKIKSRISCISPVLLPAIPLPASVKYCNFCLVIKQKCGCNFGIQNEIEKKIRTVRCIEIIEGKGIK